MIANILLLNKITVYTIIAGAISAFGLLNNSIPVIIGSMIVSPLLTPFSKTLVHLIFKNNVKYQFIYTIIKTILLIILLILIGFVFGLINNKTETFRNETDEMLKRAYIHDGKYNTLVSELGVGFFVGIGLPIAILLNDTALLVAFGIAPSICPPIVNGGLYFANYLFSKDNEDKHKATNTILVGITNIFSIVIVATLSLFIYKYMNIKTLKKLHFPTIKK